MLSLVARGSASAAARSLPRTSPHTRALVPGSVRKASTTAPPSGGPGQAKDFFGKSAKMDPELYGIFAVTFAVVGAFGYYFGSKPTSASDSRNVPAVPGSEPWRGEGSTGKYKYYPQGDLTQAPKDAPSALNVAIIPNVNLPKELHEKYNKWGKAEWEI